MPKFSAAHITDLMTKEAALGRLARIAGYLPLQKFEYSVMVEADDGSWFELDAETLLHASVLADIMVGQHSARGASVRLVDQRDGSVSNRIHYKRYAS